MSRRPKPVPFTEDDLVTGELRRGPRSRRGLTVTVVIVLLLVVAAAAYAVTFAPDHYAKLQAERLGGDATVEVGGGVQVLPDVAWVAQPRVTNLVEWAPLPPLRDWAVLTGTETGIELLSPDRGLSVEFSVAGTETQETTKGNTAWLAEAERAGDQGAAQVRTETLASGAELRHVDSGQEIRAVVSLGATEVRVFARTTSTAESTAPADISVYRPALSAVLETLTQS